MKQSIAIAYIKDIAVIFQLVSLQFETLIKLKEIIGPGESFTQTDRKAIDNKRRSERIIPV
jgi:hypothetical protein